MVRDLNIQMLLTNTVMVNVLLSWYNKRMLLSFQ
jgi:hypothetical protein